MAGIAWEAREWWADREDEAEARMEVIMRNGNDGLHYQQAPADSVSETLRERGNRYGSFARHAAITQGIKGILRASPSWDDMDDDMQEACEMIAHKLARIVNGDPHYSDSWLDIAGYARLVYDRLEGNA